MVVFIFTTLLQNPLGKNLIPTSATVISPQKGRFNFRPTFIYLILFLWFETFEMSKKVVGKKQKGLGFMWDDLLLFNSLFWECFCFFAAFEIPFGLDSQSKNGDEELDLRKNMWRSRSPESVQLLWLCAAQGNKAGFNIADPPLLSSATSSQPHFSQISNPTIWFSSGTHTIFLFHFLFFYKSITIFFFFICW